MTQGIRLDMLEVMGRGYVMEYCISSLRKWEKELEYRVYITDALKAIAENTAKNVGGTFLTKRYVDSVLPSNKKEVTSAQVVSKMKKKIGGGR